MYKLFNYQPSGNCYKLRLLLSQLGIEYESVEVDILEGESRTDDFLNINPNGRVPVLQVEDEHLPESNAALWYLAEESKFIPQDRLGRAQVLQWMFFEQYSHEPYIASVRFWVSLLKDRPNRLSEIQQRMPLGYAALSVMEIHLAANDFFVGGAYSIADIALYAYTHVAEEGGYDLSPYPKIRRWFDRVESQAGYIPMLASRQDG
ncbi:glutathione S-transferase family protein [Gilvimarinus chinensis]|uniref:glutathione S-transferase family protein n=1 Tax=Gilvimarinus chinensis TaxID=396005 RepID=UPI00036BA351|nr:glutathione S-transferase family protein [Gilvimarinus chinensis]